LRVEIEEGVFEALQDSEEMWGTILGRFERVKGAETLISVK